MVPYQSTMVEVDLSWCWPALEHLGHERQDRHDGQYDPRAGRDSDPYEIHVWGVASEFATAMVTGLPWSGFSGVGAPDVGDDIQVRSTKLDFKRGLIVYPRDDPDHRFVLAYMDPPRVVLAGWAWAADVMQDWFWFDRMPKPAYRMPIEHLLPMSSLAA